MGSAQKQGDLWGQAPSDWAFIQEPLHRPLFSAMLSAADVDAGTRLLDAGCGGGGASVLADERGAVVSGLDAVQGFIEIARERLPEGDFRVGDIQELPFDDDAFDVVFAANSLQYSADRVATLQEFKRVCRQDGRITVGLFSSPEQVAFRAIQQAVRSTLPEPPPGKGPYELSEAGKLESLFEEAGLKVIDSGEVDCPFVYPDYETFWRSNASAGPFQNAMRMVGEDRLREATREALEAFSTDEGGYVIGPNMFKYIVGRV